MSMESNKLDELHRLLKRQIRNALDEHDLTQIEGGVAKLVELVSDAYDQTDMDRALLERSLELTSSELTTRNRELQTRLEEQEAMKAELEESYSLLNAKPSSESCGSRNGGLSIIGNLIEFMVLNLGDRSRVLTQPMMGYSFWI